MVNLVEEIAMLYEKGERGVFTQEEAENRKVMFEHLLRFLKAKDAIIYQSGLKKEMLIQSIFIDVLKKDQVQTSLVY